MTVHPLHPFCHLRLLPLTRSFILLVCSKLTSTAGRSIICLILAVHRQRANLRLRCNDLTITRFPSENTSWLGSFGELNYLIRLSVRFRDWIGTTCARVLVEARSLFTRDTAPWNYSSRSDQQWERTVDVLWRRGGCTHIQNVPFQRKAIFNCPSVGSLLRHIVALINSRLRCHGIKLTVTNYAKP